MKEIEKHACCGGTLAVYTHDSESLSCPMTFSLFLPPQAAKKKVPLIIFLSGLTCTYENFTTKAGAYKRAAEKGVAILAPDTSPRGDDIPDDKDSYDFGKGAGFYINATQAPWAKNYQMESYIVEELPQIVGKEFSVDIDRHGIAGHSMGGHGALTLYLKYPDLYKSVSAFSPIVAPTFVPWGQKAFSRYLGEDHNEWKKHDACTLMRNAQSRPDFAEILVDQGLADNFLEEQLKPELFEEACTAAGQALNLRLHDGYDHSYYFIQTFINDHIDHHVDILEK